MKRTLLFAAGLLVVAACGQSVDLEGSGTSTSAASTESSTTTTSTPGQEDQVTTPDETDQLIKIATKARADLAKELDVPEADLQLVSTQPVTWRDGSIGCPDPGSVYTQALVDGYLIIFEIEGVRYQVHQQNDDEPFLCLEPATDAFIPPTKKAPEISIPPPIR